MKRKVVIIGAGFGGLSAASYLAKDGFDVTILEKNSWLGGRAQVFKKSGFTFDLGPSWYWMPKVFEQFYSDFGYSINDFYKLIRLNPSYRVYFADEYKNVPATRQGLCELFEKYETGSGQKLEKYLNKAQKVYAIAMSKFIPKVYNSYFSLFNKDIIIGGLQIIAQINIFHSVKNHLQKYFKNEKLLKILQFPIFFLGAPVNDIPSVYSLMSHVDFVLGTWYPSGGFGKVVEAFKKIAVKEGVKILTDQEVIKINVQDGVAINVVTKTGKSYPADIIISNSDYYQTENSLLEHRYGSYSEKYWEKRQLAPSAFLIHLGLNKKINHLLHHSLFFHNNWDAHNKALFEDLAWPTKPLYYIACPSKTDPTVAPKDCDLLTILVPIASGLKDTKELRDKYFNLIINDLEKIISQNISKSIIVKKFYCLKDFISDYNAYKGNAYGLGQTANQTAIFRPSHKSKKVKNLYYTGQFTVPGIGVPLVILSGKIIAKEVLKKYGV